VELHVHGVRGSTPVSGPAFARYGGHTSCFSIRLGPAELLIVDCGTGLLSLQEELHALGMTDGLHATVLLTHFHWDHIQGLPFFGPVYDSSARFHIIASSPDDMTIEEALEGAIRPPWFPLGFSDWPAEFTFEELSEEPLSIGGLKVRSTALLHPGGVQAYRIEHGDRSIVLATDVQAGDAEADRELRSLARNASVLIHDAQYTAEEWSGAHEGWGHSTWEHAVAVAHDAGVERLILTSHDPSRSDADVDALVVAARPAFPALEAAFPGQVIEL